jgi:hypothetical protein
LIINSWLNIFTKSNALMGKENNFRKYLSKEDLLQEACVRYLQFQHRDILWFHVPNEGKRSEFERYKFKVLGSSAGVSDLIIVEQNRTSKGLAIEIKYGRNKCTENQVEFLEKMSKKGYTAAVVYDHVDEFIKIIKDYLDNKLEGSEGHILLFKDGEMKVFTYEEARGNLIPKNSPHLQGKRKPNQGMLFQNDGTESKKENKLFRS